MFPGQALLDALLPFAQPVRCGIDLAGLDRRHAFPGRPQRQAQGRACRLGPVSARRVESLEPGAMTRATIIATARSLSRTSPASSLPPASNRSSPKSRSVPSTAETWPCGKERRISKASPASAKATPPLRSVRKPCTTGIGSLERLARVRFLTLPPSRQLSRNSTAGGDVRLGTISMNIATENRSRFTLSRANYMDTKP